MYSQLSPKETEAWLKSARPPKLLDVRQPEEHELVSLPGSVLIPLGELYSRSDELEAWKEQDVVVYCHHGVRSLNAIGQLKHLGFTKLHNLAGGIDRWSLEVDRALPRY